MCDATSSREDATLLVNEERCPTNVEEGDAVSCYLPLLPPMSSIVSGGHVDFQ